MREMRGYAVVRNLLARWLPGDDADDYHDARVLDTLFSEEDRRRALQLGLRVERLLDEEFPGLNLRSQYLVWDALLAGVLHAVEQTMSDQGDATVQVLIDYERMVINHLRRSVTRLHAERRREELRRRDGAHPGRPRPGAPDAGR